MPNIAIEINPKGTPTPDQMAEVGQFRNPHSQNTDKSFDQKTGGHFGSGNRLCPNTWLLHDAVQIR